MLCAPSNRDQVSMPASQLGFLKAFHIQHAFVVLSAIAPAFVRMALQHLDSNAQHYSNLVEQGVTTL